MHFDELIERFKTPIYELWRPSSLILAKIAAKQSIVNDDIPSRAISEIEKRWPHNNTPKKETSYRAAWGAIAATLVEQMKLREGGIKSSIKKKIVVHLPKKKGDGYSREEKQFCEIKDILEYEIKCIILGSTPINTGKRFSREQYEFVINKYNYRISKKIEEKEKLKKKKEGNLKAITKIEESLIFLKRQKIVFETNDEMLPELLPSKKILESMNFEWLKGKKRILFASILANLSIDFIEDKKNGLNIPIEDLFCALTEKVTLDKEPDINEYWYVASLPTLIININSIAYVVGLPQERKTWLRDKLKQQVGCVHDEKKHEYVANIDEAIAVLEEHTISIMEGHQLNQYHKKIFREYSEATTKHSNSLRNYLLQVLKLRRNALFYGVQANKDRYYWITKVNGLQKEYFGNNKTNFLNRIQKDLFSLTSTVLTELIKDYLINLKYSIKGALDVKQVVKITNLVSILLDLYEDIVRREWKGVINEKTMSIVFWQGLSLLGDSSDPVSVKNYNGIIIRLRDKFYRFDEGMKWLQTHNEISNIDDKISMHLAMLQSLGHLEMFLDALRNRNHENIQVFLQSKLSTVEAISFINMFVGYIAFKKNASNYTSRLSCISETIRLCEGIGVSDINLARIRLEIRNALGDLHKGFVKLITGKKGIKAIETLTNEKIGFIKKKIFDLEDIKNQKTLDILTKYMSYLESVEYIICMMSELNFNFLKVGKSIYDERLKLEDNFDKYLRRRQIGKYISPEFGKEMLDSLLKTVENYETFIPDLRNKKFSVLRATNNQVKTSPNDEIKKTKALKIIDKIDFREPHRIIFESIDNMWDKQLAIVERSRLYLTELFFLSMGEEALFKRADILLRTLARTKENSRLNYSSKELLTRLISINSGKVKHSIEIDHVIITLTKEEATINASNISISKKITSMHSSVKLLQNLEALYNENLPEVVCDAVLPITNMRISKFQKRIDKFREMSINQYEDIAQDTVEFSSNRQLKARKFREVISSISDSGPELQILGKDQFLDDIEEDNFIASQWMKNRFMLKELIQTKQKIQNKYLKQNKQIAESRKNRLTEIETELNTLQSNTKNVNQNSSNDETKLKIVEDLEMEKVDLISRSKRFKKSQINTHMHPYCIIINALIVVKSWPFVLPALSYLLIIIAKVLSNLGIFKSVITTEIQAALFLLPLFYYVVVLIVLYTSKLKHIKQVFRDILIPEMVVPAVFFLGQNINTDESWALGFHGAPINKLMLPLIYGIVGYFIIRYGLLSKQSPQSKANVHKSDLQKRKYTSNKLNSRALQIMSIGLLQAFVIVAVLSMLSGPVMSSRMDPEIITNTEHILPDNLLKIDFGVLRIQIMPYLIASWTMQVFFYGTILSHLLGRVKED